MDDPDRDLIDVIRSNLDGSDRVRRLVMARCGDVLSDGEIAEAFAGDLPAESIIPLPGPGTAEAWAEVMENILDALEAMEERLDRIEASLKEDDG